MAGKPSSWALSLPSCVSAVSALKQPWGPWGPPWILIAERGREGEVAGVPH